MSDATGMSSAETAPKRRSWLAAFLTRLVKEKPLGTASGIIILIWILIAIFADALTPYPPFEMNLADRLQGASAQHLLGTDHIGRDVLSRLILGARTSILIGLAATALSTVIGTLIGGTSGFLGGKFDIVVQRVVDAWIVFPGLLLLLTIMSIVGRGIPQIILVLGISGGIGGSRLIRSAVIAIKGSDNFLAAEAVGNTKWRSLTRHVLPNVMPVVIIMFSITVGGVILSIASLSFLGYGLPPTTPDWGGLLSREGRQYMEQAPWLAVWPGLCLTIAVYCLNMLGDAIRDLLDPRLRGGEGRYGATGKRKRGLLSRLLNPFS
ncbi:MAG: ABC transporter permease [Spirochaetaceae bacterium]|nr:ABC transporter permease [Spirochaetaceae bacterium]